MDFCKFYHSDFGSVRVFARTGFVPLFVAKDIVAALKFGSLTNPISKYCVHAVLSTSLEEKVKCMRLIPESDVHRLIARSKGRNALLFQDWFFEEVLPKLGDSSFLICDDVRQEQVRNTSKTKKRNATNNEKKTEERIKALEDKLERVIEQISIFDDIDKNYSTLAGYIQKHGLPIYVSDFARLGSTISETCKRRGIKVSKITDTRGSINLYPNYILHEQFKSYMK